MNTRAILVSLSISAWSARKYDKKVTKDTNEAHNASHDAGRYNKMLLPGDASTYKALAQHIAAARLRHTEQTLPWSDEGRRILPIKNFDKYTDITRADQHKFNSLLNDFWHDYPRLREDAKAKLNGMYLESDYPEDVRGRYSFKVVIDPVPTGSDYRVALPQDDIDHIAATTEERVKQAFADAQADAVKRLYSVVEKIRERLTTKNTCTNCGGKGEAVETRKGPEKGTTVPCWICEGVGKTNAEYRDTLITNARELCDILTRLNVADDPNLEKARAEVELLAITEPQILREDEKARTNTAKRAQDILDAMTATYGRNLFA